MHYILCTLIIIYTYNINNYIAKYTTLEYICILATQDTSQIRYYWEQAVSRDDPTGRQ